MKKILISILSFASLSLFSQTYFQRHNADFIKGYNDAYESNTGIRPLGEVTISRDNKPVEARWDSQQALNNQLSAFDRGYSLSLPEKSRANYSDGYFKGVEDSKHIGQKGKNVK